MIVSVPPWTPQWTAKMYPPKVGRDHLGLGSVSSDQILPSLVPGINVLTYHPRYHSLYAFLLTEFWERSLPRTRTAWVNFFRPRDYLFSLAANLCDQPEHGVMRNIVGGQVTAPLAAEGRAAYPATYDYIKTELAGYELYYRSVMIDLGLILPGGPGFQYKVDVPTEEGKQLAAAFRSGIEHTTYYKDYFSDNVEMVPTDVIREYIRSACLCQLQSPSAPDRRLVQQAFLYGGNEQAASGRRQTLRLMLDVAHQTETQQIDSGEFRQLIFFGASDSGAHYGAAAGLEETWRRWRLYQAREYYAFALNTLWRHLCRWGLAQDGDVRPIPVTRFWEYLGQCLDMSGIAEDGDTVGLSISAESDVLTVLNWLQSTLGSTQEGFDEACRLSAPVNEHRMYCRAHVNRDDAAVEVAGMLVLLLLLYMRFGEPQVWLKPEWGISCMGADGRRSVDGFMRELRRRLHAGPFSLLDLAKWLYSDYVILQHQVVAASKLPDNTYRFQWEGNRLRFFDLDASVEFLDSRFDAMATTVHELGLCGDIRWPEHSLSEEGHQLLLTGDVRWMN